MKIEGGGERVYFLTLEGVDAIWVGDRAAFCTTKFATEHMQKYNTILSTNVLKMQR